MRCEHSLVCAGVLAATLLLVSCSPGSNSTDVQPRAAATTTPVSGPDSFLLFPNPQQQPDGSLQTNTVAYATAYYEAIDPNNDKDTLAKWKAANGFGSSSGSSKPRNARRHASSCRVKATTCGGAGISLP